VLCGKIRENGEKESKLSLSKPKESMSVSTHMRQFQAEKKENTISSETHKIFICPK
jgi:hypothetical protein